MGIFEVPFLDLPFRDPVPVFAIAIVVFLLAPLLLEQFRLPGIIGVLLVGILIGPHVLNVLPRGRTIRLLGMIGLLYLLFVSGLEIDLLAFFEDPKRVATFGLLTFLLPMGLGVAGGIAVLDYTLLSAVLFAAMFSSHTILSYPVLQQLDILKNNAVTTTVSVALLTDTTALIILAVVENVALHADETSLLFWAGFAFKLAIFFVGVWVLVPRIGRWFFRNVHEESYFEYLFALAVVFGVASLATLFGADPIVGAFLAGISMNRLVPSTGTLMNRIEFVGNALFIPFFFLSVGMLVRPQIFLRSVEPWIVAGTMLGVMVATKFVAAVVTGRIYAYERHEWLTMFGISTGQGPAAIAIALIGAESGLFGQTLVNAVVLLIAISAVISPYLTERFGREVVQAEEKQEYEPSEAPERILVPVTRHTENRDLLLDLAMLVRGSNSEEPIHTLTVVRNEEQLSAVDTLDADERQPSHRPGIEMREAVDPDLDVDGDSGSAGGGGDGGDGDGNGNVDGDRAEDDGTESEVAEAEETLGETEEYAAGAEIPIDAQTRVDDDVVSGIARAITDNRITTVIVGWNGGRRFGRRIFGSTIDRLLERTDELFLVASLNEPLNTTERLVVVLPGSIAVHPGFYEGVHVVKRLATELGMPLRVLLVDGDEDQYERLVGAVTPETTFEIETVADWGRVHPASGDRFEGGDLVLPLIPRRGSRGWERALGGVTRDLAGAVPGNLVVVYLAEEETEGGRERHLRL